VTPFISTVHAHAMEEAAAHHAVQLKALDDRVQQVCRPALLWLCRDGIVTCFLI
jgi:hypothetical protein